MIVKPWADSFYHAAIVRMFRDAHGMGTLENVLLPGQTAPIYHYASYSIPALLCAAADTPCYLSLTAFQVPLGIVLTGFAAFALAKSWWGPGAGLGAVIALLLLPDASFYGVKNPFLSADWLQQIAPSGAYGVALTALAWLLVVEGCRDFNARVIACGFLAAGTVVFYKAHLFVANAFLIWVAPSLLVPGVRPARRLGWFVSAVAVYVGLASLARFVPSAPILRLDGSGMHRYVDQLAFNLGDGWAKNALSLAPDAPFSEALCKGTAHLFLGTFGLLGPVCLVLAFWLARRRGEPRRIRVAIALFPVAIVANYLVMSLGLAPDEGSVTTSDELLHRPLVWAYFAVASWVGGAVYESVLKTMMSRFRIAKTLLLPIVLGLFLVPFVCGIDVQVGPAWGKELTETRVPADLVRCATFLREQTRRGGLVLDSSRDPRLVLGALSERPEFVVDYFVTRFQPLLARRLEDALALEQMTDIEEIYRHAADRHIRWYVLHPGGRVAWPLSHMEPPAFQAGEFRVYSLRHPPEGTY